MALTEKAESTQGANALTGVLSQMIDAKIGAQAPVLDFGEILGNYSLKLNHFSKPIPKSDYSVARHLLYNPKVPLTETYFDGSHPHPTADPPGLHSHKVRLPKKMYHLRPGDRVLVARVANEFVVLDIIYDAKHLPSEPKWK